MPAIRPNRAKEKLQRGEVVTTISGLQDSDIIDFLGPLGFDAAWIECEHGPVDWGRAGRHDPGLRSLGDDLDHQGQRQ